MILVTGGTGFVGRNLVQHLLRQQKRVRILVRPSKKTPNLPKDTTVEVVVCSLQDERGLRAAMKGVQQVVHLASAERAGSRADIEEIDVQGTRRVAAAAVQAGVQRLFYLSHVGADRGSAYSVLKVKGIAEGLIQLSGISHAVIRSTAIYGEGDHFTTSFSRLLQTAPGVVLIPGDGGSMLQPIWIEDVVTCILSAMDAPEDENRIYIVGGPEYFSFRQVLDILSEKLGITRRYISIHPSVLRSLWLIFEQGNPRFPVSIHWLDHLAADRTCPVDSIAREFGLLPSRFTQHLDHLHPDLKKRRQNQ
jgi:uncharacterized protein YbjT (DUF2867 family)